MSNVVFELLATLGLDSSQFNKGLSDSKGLASSVGGAIGNGFKAMAKVGVAALATTTTAMGAFAATSVKTGATFDKSMSQVAATMGLTMDEMAEQTGKVELAWGTFTGNLRDYAQEMGKNTAFSASEAADALNYMALAGYDVQTSMEMLPNVLNLAAAGNMELARASDMVTDTQTAFGISLERTSQMVDEMAKAASTGNTSVEQLGDAFLVVGGLAQELNGGFINLEDGSRVAYDNIQELEIALTAMANAGIKGGEAGTHLRNMLLKLASPTDDGYKQFEALGVSVFDAEGNMRSLAGIMEDLGSAMDGLTQEEKLQAISDIFNTRDTAAAEALLNAVGEDWGEIAESILDADGAAQQMADTQLDNLAGDITLFKSALEGAQIAVSDQLTPALRDFVQFGTQGLSKITDAFQSGGLEGAMEAFGGILSDGLNMIIEKAPAFVSAGMKLLGALGKGLLDNIDTILDATLEIAKQLGEGLITAAPEILKGTIELMLKLGEFLTENVGEIIPAIVEMISQMALMIADNAPAIIQGAIELLLAIGQALIDSLDVLIPAIVQVNIAIMQAMLENLPLLLEGLLQLVVALAQAIIEYAPYFTESMGTMGLMLIDYIVTWGAQLLTMIGEWFTGLIEQAGEWISNLIDSISTWLSQLPSKMAYYAGVAVANFIKFFMDLPTNLQTWLTETINKIVSWATDMKNKATNTGKDFFNGVIDNIKNLPTKMKQLGADLIKAIADLPEKAKNIGKNLVDGLKNGITEKWQGLKDTFSNLADGFMDGVKSVFGIASPSKVFKYYGHMLDAGLAQGLTDFSYLVTDALDSVTSEINMEPQLAVAGAGVEGGQVGVYNQTVNVYSPTALTPSEVARQTRNATRDMVLELRGKR